jgi:hypothetical protein
VEKPLDLFSLQSQVRSCPGIFLQFSDIEKLAIFSQILAKFTMKKKKSHKTTKCLHTKLNDPMCVMKVALQRFAYIDALY